MKKLMILMFVFAMFCQSITFTNAEEPKETKPENTYQSLDGIQTSVESKPLYDVPATKKMNLPQRYDARDEGLVTSVKNQGSFGVCWAYSLASMAETQFLKKGYATEADEVDFNELQLAYGFYHRKDDPLGLTPNDYATALGDDGDRSYLLVGGNHQLTSYYLAQWASVVNEEDFPNANTFETLPSGLDEKYSYDQTDFIMTDAHYLPNDDIEAIKEAIYTYGSVATAYFSNGEYYKPHIYHDDKNQQVNHAVTLVGWDDTISKEEFASSNDEGKIPSRDGAWIMKNSWGTVAGEDGYFYLSYDMMLNTTTAFEFEKRDLYDNNYFYDGSYSILWWNPYKLQIPKFANVFQAQKASSQNKEKLEAVSVGIASSNTTYSVQIFRLKDNFKNPSDGEALLDKPVTGTVKYPGSYTIELNQPIELNENEYFAVVVTLEAENPQMYIGNDYTYSFIDGNEECGKNQSYTYDGSYWYDMSQWDNGYVARIRAYTTNERISEQRNQLNALIEEVETYQLNAEYASLSDADKTTFVNSLNEAQSIASNTKLTDAQYLEAYQDLSKAFDKAKKEVTSIQDSKTIFQTKINEINEWLESVDASILSQTELDALNTTLNASENSLKQNLSSKQLNEQILQLQNVFDQALDYVAENKPKLAALQESIESLETLMNGENHGYISNEQLESTQKMIDESNAIISSRNEKQYDSKTTVNKTKYGQLQSVINSAIIAQDDLQQDYAIVQQFLMDNQAYLFVNEVEELSVVLNETAVLMNQKVPQSQYVVQKEAIAQVYENLQTIVAERKVEEAKNIDLAKTTLYAEMQIFEATDLNKYTIQSKNEYYEAYAMAEAIYYKSNATIDELRTARINLENAKKALILAPVVPEAVSDLKAEILDYKTVKLSWSAVDHATSYEVYRKGYKDTSQFTLVATINGTSYHSSSLMTGKTYSYYVVAKNEVGKSSKSSIVAMAPKLMGNVKLSIVKESKTKFKLSWNKINGATRYMIYRKRNQDDWRKLLTLGGDDFSYTTSEMPEGTYQYIVKAGRYDSKDRVMTGSSNSVKVTSTFDEIKVSLKAGSKQIKVSWDKIEGVTHYEIYRATQEKGTYKKLKTTTETSYTAKSLTSNKKYFFKVRGYKSYNNGKKTEKIYTKYSEVKSAVAK